jgi:aryl-alcohol dehydrogenase-like predicted oxidoreductase
MEYVDVVYCHRPDATTPIEETVRAMNWVIDQGWAFYWGTSEWTAQQITEAWGVANRLDLVGPIVEQPEYNLFSRHKVPKLNLILPSTTCAADLNLIPDYGPYDSSTAMNRLTHQ